MQKKHFNFKNLKLSEVTSGQSIKLDFNGAEKNGRFIGSGLFWTLVSSAMVLGATAAYFKIKADKNYDKFLDTGDSSFLDKTDRQDVFSGVAFGTLQLNLGALVYFFLTE